MSWLSTKHASYIGVGETTKPSDIQKKVFHMRFDYRTYNKNAVKLSTIKQKRRSLDPIHERKRKRKLKVRRKKAKRLQQQQAFQKAKKNLLSILFAENDMKHNHIREVMDLSWNTHKHIILKGETSASPLHHRLHEIHEKEMVLLAAAKKGTQKKMRKKEIGLSQGIDHHELVDEDIYKLAIEFAEKKENKEKVDKVKLDFQKQKLEAGLSKYVEEKRMETKEARRKKAEETSKNVSEQVHANVARPPSRESRPQSREGSDKNNDELPELPELKVVSEEDSSNDKMKEQETICGPESDVNVRANDSKNNEKKQESTTILEPLRNVMQTDQGHQHQATKDQNNNEGDGSETDNLDAAGKELLFHALGLSSDAKYYRLNKYKSSIKYQASITNRLIASKRRVWELREKYRPVHRKYLEIPEGYEMKDGQYYTLRAYSHCNGFVNPHFHYVGIRPYRCCPTRGEPRHLYDRSYMLLEKVEKQVKKNKFVGRWTEPVYHWIKDFRSRSEALDFAKKHGIEDVRF